MNKEQLKLAQEAIKLAQGANKIINELAGGLNSIIQNTSKQQTSAIPLSQPRLQVAAENKAHHIISEGKNSKQEAFFPGEGHKSGRHSNFPQLFFKSRQTSNKYKEANKKLKEAEMGRRENYGPNYGGQS